MLSGPNQPAPVPYVFGLPSSQFHTSPFMLPSSSSNGASSSRKRTINEELREHKRPALNNRPNSAFKSGDGFGFLKVGFENPPPPQLNRALPNGPFHSLAEMEMGTPGVPAPVAPAAVQNAARRIPGQPALSTSCAHHASQDSPDAYEARCYYGGCRWCKAALCQSCARRCDGCGVTDLCLVCASGFLPQGVRLEGELTLCPGCLRSHTEAPAAVASTPIQQQQFQQQQSSSLFKFVGGVGQLIGGSGNTASTANGGHDDDDAMML